MVSKFLNVDVDPTLARNSNTAVASQKAVKTYVDTEIAKHEGDGLNTSILKKAKAWEYTQTISSGDTLVYSATEWLDTFSSKRIVNTGYFGTGVYTSHFILLSSGELYYSCNTSISLVETENTCQQVKGCACLRQDGSLFAANNMSSTYLKALDTRSSGPGMSFTDFTAGGSAVWGICNGSIYLIGSNNVTLVNSNRTWVRLLNIGANLSGYYLLASDSQNKLFLVSVKQTNTEIDTNISFNESVIMKGGIIGPYYYCWVIVDGALYQVGASASSCVLLNNTEIWTDCLNSDSHSLAITSTGKLYRGNNGSAPIQEGTDTDWQALGGGTREGFGVLKGGNLYSFRTFGGLDCMQLTTSGNFSAVYGGYCRSTNGNGGLTFGLTGSEGQTIHRVFTNFNPSVGDKTYSSYNPPQEDSTITAINSSYLTDGNHTYQRNSNHDQEFSQLNAEILNKPITVGILLEVAE